MCQQPEKNLLTSNVSFTCPRSLLNFGPLTAEIGWRVWAPQKISTCFVSWLHYCRVHRRPTKLGMMLGHLLGWYIIYAFSGGFCPLTEVCQVQNSLCVQVLRSPTLAALLHGTRPLGISQTLRRGTRNGIMELLQRAPPVFDWLAISLGIGTHSSYYSVRSYSFAEYWKHFMAHLNGVHTFRYSSAGSEPIWMKFGAL